MKETNPNNKVNVDLTLNVNQKKPTADMKNASFYQENHPEHKLEVTQGHLSMNNKMNKDCRKYEDKNHYKVGEE